MDINRQWDLRKESALWLVHNFPSLKCNNHKEGEGLFFFLSVYIFLVGKQRPESKLGKQVHA